MDGLAIAAAVTEIERSAIGGSIRTVFAPDPGTFVLHIFSGRALRLLVSPRKALIHLTGLDLPHPQTPSPFTMLLRKHLRGGRITAVKQEGWERVVRIEITRRSQAEKTDLTLIAELIGVRGNLILVRDGRVVAALRADPRAQPGEEYRPLPRQGKLDPRKVDPQVISELLTADDPVRALVRRIDGIGKETAQVIAAQAGGSEGVASRLAEIVSHVARPIGCYDPNRETAFFFPVESGVVLASFSAALDREYEEEHADEHYDQEKESLRRGLERALAKRRRTLAKLTRWLEDAEKEGTLRRYADLIMIHLNELTRGIDRAQLLDLESGASVEVPLNPRLGPVENAQALYERAKRLRRGRPRVEARKRRLEKEIAILETGLAALAAGDIPSAEALSLLPPESKQRTSRAVPLAPRTYRIDGYLVEVGKSALENDSLLKRARPDDLWFHAKGVPGAHVVVRRQGREEIPREVIEQAARLAAGASKARDEPKVEVSYTAVKHVRKPKGAPPGLVILDREETITVAPLRKNG